MSDNIATIAVIGVVLVILFAATYLLACAQSAVTSALAITLPVGTLVHFVRAWIDDHQSTSGDPQPLLIVVTGSVVTGTLLAGAIAGWAMRYRRRQR